MSESARRNQFGQPIGAPIERPLPTGPPSTSPIDGSHCTLRALDAHRDTHPLFSAYAEAQDGRDWTYLPYGPFDDAAGLGAWLSSVERSDDPAFFTVVDRDGACGVASYLRIMRESGSIEVGHIHLAPRLQGTTAATEAMYLMMRRAFDAGYRRYEWKCDALNAPSRVAARRLGFTFEGVFRQATVYKGRNRDTAWFSILDAEWPGVRDEFERWLDPANFDGSGRQRTPLRMPHTA